MQNIESPPFEKNPSVGTRLLGVFLLAGAKLAEVELLWKK